MASCVAHLSLSENKIFNDECLYRCSHDYTADCSSLLTSISSLRCPIGLGEGDDFSDCSFGGSQSHHVKANGLSTTKLNSVCKTSALTIQKKSNQKSRKFSVSARYGDGSRRGSGGDFVAGFLLGGAVFGAVAYIFAPQIRRSIMSEEDEYGFKKPQEPTYYDEGLEKTRETLNEKIGQLNSAIDNVSSRLRGRGKNTSSPNVPVETDPEVEATT